MPRFTRSFASAVFLFFTAVSLAAGGCHDESTGCCVVCSGSCACGNACISCAAKCMLGPGCACNSTVSPEAPSGAQAAVVAEPISESPDVAAEPISESLDAGH